LMNGLGYMVKQDISNGNNLTPAGYSRSVAIPGSIQFVSAGSKAVGGTWTGMMCMTYMFALMGIQSLQHSLCGPSQIKLVGPFAGSRLSPPL